MITDLDHRAIKAGLWYVISNIVAKAISVTFTPIFSRLLSQDAFGEYSTFLSWLHVLAIVFTFNLSSTILRANFDYESKKDYNTFVYSVMLFSTIFPALLCGSIILIIELLNIQLPIPDYLLFCLCLMIVFSSQVSLILAKERASLKYRNISVITNLYAITSILIPFSVVMLFGEELKCVIWGMTANDFLWGTGLLIAESRKLHNSVNFQCINYALKLGVPIVPHTLAGILMGNSDKIMIMSLCGAESVAIYSVAFTCSLAISLLRNSIGAAWSPWFYNSFIKMEYKEIKVASSLLVFVATLGILLICFLSPEIVLIFGGERYDASKHLMPMIMLGCYYNFLNLFYIDIEFYYKEVKMISVITVIAGGANIILNYYGIIHFGYFAAAVTTAFVNGGILLAHYMITLKYRNWIFIDNKLFFGSAIFLTMICINLHMIYDFTVLRYSLTGALFVGLMFFLKYIYSKTYSSTN